tara:strand:- start:1834 stop:2181 length:348 start_codon:yes stop_codon:yes gene_type:complete
MKKMKNLFSIIAFAFVMMLSVQNVSAQSVSQNKDRPEVIAKTQLLDLSNQLELTGEQNRTLYRALVTKEVSLRNSEENKATMTVDKKKANEVFYSQMKKTLTAEQFKKWEDSLKK